MQHTYPMVGTTKQLSMFDASLLHRKQHSHQQLTCIMCCCVCASFQACSASCTAAPLSRHRSLLSTKYSGTHHKYPMAGTTELLTLKNPCCIADNIIINSSPVACAAACGHPSRPALPPAQPPLSIIQKNIVLLARITRTPWQAQQSY
jgi:hypothetical protein